VNTREGGRQKKITQIAGTSTEMKGLALHSGTQTRVTNLDGEKRSLKKKKWGLILYEERKDKKPTRGDDNDRARFGGKTKGKVPGLNKNQFLRQATFFFGQSISTDTWLPSREEKKATGNGG